MNTQSKSAGHGRGMNASRRAAASMLSAIERGKTLDEARDKLDGLAPSDRAFANAMVLAALRHYGEIEGLLRPFMKRPIPGRSHLARALLYIGVAQIVYLKVAPHAAINETVGATGRREQPFRGLINAVLRRVVDAVPVQAEPLSSLPEWMVDSWQTAYGAAACAAIAQNIQKLPALDLQFVSAAATEPFCAAMQARIDEATQREGDDTAQISAQPSLTRLSDDCLRLENAGAVENLPFFQDGTWWVQDIAASLAVRLMPLRSGQDVLDICAAPGGKTLQLAARDTRVTALDISASRMRRLRENLTRTDLDAQCETADFMAWQPGRQWSQILLDAPCSATGTLRRHPDLKLHRRAGSGAYMAKKQAEMLDKAAGLTEADGYLMFCVCSLEPEEGEGAALAFLERNPKFSLAPLRADNLPAGFEEAITTQGWLRTTPAMLPEAGGCDGFFAACFHKKPTP
jgi:16S rRNA (cytosine967-C5)-methyltransferase